MLGLHRSLKFWARRQSFYFCIGMMRIDIVTSSLRFCMNWLMLMLWLFIFGHWFYLSKLHFWNIPWFLGFRTLVGLIWFFSLSVNLLDNCFQILFLFLTWLRNEILMDILLVLLFSLLLFLKLLLLKQLLFFDFFKLKLYSFSRLRMIEWF